MIHSNLPLRAALFALLLATALAHVVPVARQDAAMVTAVPIPPDDDAGDAGDDDFDAAPSVPPMEPETSAEPAADAAQGTLFPEPSELAAEPTEDPEVTAVPVMSVSPSPSAGPQDDPKKSNGVPSSFEKDGKMEDEKPKIPKFGPPMAHEKSVKHEEPDKYKSPETYEAPMMHDESKMHKTQKTHKCFMQSVDFGTGTAERCCEKRFPCGSPACKHAGACKNPDVCYCRERVCRKVSINFSHKEDEHSDVRYLNLFGF